MVLFLSAQVRDASTGEFHEGLRGQEVVVCYFDTSTPMEITEAYSGVPIPGSVRLVTEQFAIPSFNTPEGVYTVDVVAANGARATLQSYEGALEEAKAARAAAQISANQATTLLGRAASQPAPGVLRLPQMPVYSTKTAALAAGAAMGGFQSGDLVFIENTDA